MTSRSIDATASSRPFSAWRGRALGTGLFVVGVLFTLAHRLNADEGQVLTGAWNLYNGARIYQDFFEFIGPATFRWVDLFFRILGPEYGSALVAAWVLLAGGLAAFVGSARRISTDVWIAATIAFVWLFFVTTPPFINHNTFSSFLAAGFTYCMLWTLRNESGWMASAAGALAAATFFFLQPKGTVLLLVGVAVLAWAFRRGSKEERPIRRWNGIAPYWGGALLVLGLGFWRWGLHPVTSVVVIASGNVSMNHGTLTYVPLAVCTGIAGLVAWACRRTGCLDRDTGFLLVLQAGLWLSTSHLPDLWHLGINAFPLLLVVGHLVTHGSRSPSRRLRYAVAVVLAVLVPLATYQSVAKSKADTARAREWIGIVEEIVGEKDFFVYTFLPSFYLELRQPNPYYNSVLFEASHPARHFRRNVELLKRHEPEYVIADYATVAKYGHPGDNAVDEYIRKRYERFRTIPHTKGVIEIWRRS